MGDHFSKQSAFYSRYRPTYPDTLFDYIITMCNEKDLAWDCATGNGQSAISLSRYFKHVYATDLSENQIAHATQKDNIEYKVEHAEKCALKNASADVITVSTALHWFDIPAFFKEADRVLKPGGLLAVWSYAGCRINTEIDRVLDYFAYTLIGEYWPKEAELVWKHQYKTISFPYPLLETPDFSGKAFYNMEELINYLRSWSGTQRYFDQHHSDPIDLIKKDLETVWGDPEEKKEITWPLILKFGKK